MRNQLQLIREKISVTPLSYTVPAESEDFRNELAIEARKITTVATPEQNREAGAVVVSIRNHIKDVHGVRMELSRPLDDAKARLIEIEEDHIAPLLEEQTRLEMLGTAWAEQERKRVEDENRRRQEEIARLEADRIAKEQAAQELADNATTKEQREAAQDAIEAANAAEIKSRSAIVAPLPEVERARGQSTRTVQRHRVLNAAQVYAARPELCTIEVRASAVLAICFAKPGATEANPDVTSVNGLALWTETKSTFRT